MSDDASLAAFGGDDEERVEDADEPSEDSAEPPEAPTFTYTSTPDGAECAACGETVEKRWHAGEGGAVDAPDLDADALVCPDCKAW